jgi:hypothetical protein
MNRAVTLVMTCCPVGIDRAPDALSPEVLRLIDATSNSVGGDWAATEAAARSATARTTQRMRGIGNSTSIARPGNGERALPIGGVHFSSSMLCTQCRQDNPHDARFCFACGKPLAVAAEALVAPMAAAAGTDDAGSLRSGADLARPRLCPSCRLLVGGTTSRCECGYDFHVGAHVIGDVANTAQGGAYYPCTIPKLLLLYQATFGLYGVYWFYQHWTREQLRTRDSMSPLARAWFCPIWCYDLARRINETAAIAGVRVAYPPALTAVAFVLLNVCFRLPDPFWIIGLLAPLALVPMQSTVNAINATLKPTPVTPRGFSVPETVIATLGVSLLMLAAIGAMFPQ